VLDTSKSLFRPTTTLTPLNTSTCAVANEEEDEEEDEEDADKVGGVASLRLAMLLDAAVEKPIVEAPPSPKSADISWT
jgi:hypothetical protein